MKILGIESSADETAASIVEDGINLVSNSISTSLTLHNKTGGIVPEIASREQLRYMIPTLHDAIVQDKNLEIGHIDAIAVTIGPGLIGSLLIGVETAKTLALITHKPIIPVNHIYAHLYANWLMTDKMPKFPSIGLIVSGGHTELFLIRSHKDWRWLGGTLDDAAGEAFDKVARLLHLGYPGGPEISKRANNYIKTNTSSYINKFPRPMLNSDDLNFSFSGLKTAVLRDLNKINQINSATVDAFSFEIQESITDVLVHKTIAAAQKHHVCSIILGGGVSANYCLREKFETQLKKIGSTISLHIPISSLCTDNAAAIASYAYYHYSPIPWYTVQANPNLEVEI